jgi:radical SAM-linked protein
MKVRMQITKETEIRFISHLDYTRTVERIIHRAKLPAAYSEGFNPHLKFAFASALAVGVTSSAEYMDIELARDMELATIVERFRQALPEGISLVEAKVMSGAVKALMAVVNLAEYNITMPLQMEATAEAVAAAFTAFAKAPIIIYRKHTPKGTREIDIKEFIAEPPEFRIAGNHVLFQLKLHIKPTGSVKPTDVLEVLSQDYQLPGDAGAAAIHRTALKIQGSGQSLTPLQL